MRKPVERLEADFVRKRSRIRRATSAFTLIELLVVLVIIGILAAIATPYFGEMLAGGSLRTGAREFASVCKYARTMALLNQTPVDVSFGQGGAKLTVTAREMREASGWGMSDLAALTNDVGYTESLLGTSARKRASLGGGFGIAMSRGERDDAVFKSGASATNTMSIIEDYAGGEVAQTVSFADSINAERTVKGVKFFFDEHTDTIESRSAWAKISAAPLSYKEDDSVVLRFRANGTVRPCKIRVENEKDEYDRLTISINPAGRIKIESDEK